MTVCCFIITLFFNENPNWNDLNEAYIKRNEPSEPSDYKNSDFIQPYNFSNWSPVSNSREVRDISFSDEKSDITNEREVE